MNDSSRRSFLTTAAGLAGTALLPQLVKSQTTTSSEWDLSWIDGLKGKHKQVFDMHELGLLRAIRNWLYSYEEVYSLSASDLSAVIGIAGGAFPINASDELYKKYPLGEEWKITDPKTEKPALRNIYLEGGKTVAEQEATVLSLQSNGVIFWQCNFALNRVAASLAKKVDRPTEDVYKELRAGLNPGVILIPAHSMLLGLVQERGCAYQHV